MNREDALFEEGVRLFNEGNYFECHEVLEELWNLQEEPEKLFTQGLIQIAVALYHLNRANIIGARKLLVRGLPRIASFQPVHRQIDVATLHAEATQLLETIGQETTVSSGAIVLRKQMPD